MSQQDVELIRGAFEQFVATGDAILCRVRDGKMARLDYFNNRADAFAAAGL